MRSRPSLRTSTFGAVGLAAILLWSAGCSGSDDAADPVTTTRPTTTMATDPTDPTDPTATTADPSGGGELGEPLADQTPPAGTNGIAFDADGRLWIADLAGGQLLAVDPSDGAILVRLGAEEGVRTPDDLVFDAEGRLWWSENGAGNVGRIDDPTAEGATSETVTELGPGVNPVAIADDGSIFVARTLAGDELYRLDPDDPGSPTLVKAAPGQLNAFAFGAGGLLYAPRFVDDSGRVSAVDPETGEATDLVTDLPLVVSVKVAPDGTLRVLTIGPSTVTSVDPETGDPGSSVEVPSAVVDNQAFDATGDLWVSTFDQPTVWRLPSDGGAPVELTIGA